MMDDNSVAANEVQNDNAKLSSPMESEIHDVPSQSETILPQEEVGPSTEQQNQLEDYEVKPKKKRMRFLQDGRSWNDMFFELMAFRVENGHVRVPYHSGSLGRWVARQRNNKTALSEAQIKVLDSIEFSWDVSRPPPDAAWQTHYEELIAFKNQHGHCNVPQSTALGRWVKMQREQFWETKSAEKGEQRKRAKARPCMPDDRRQKLDDIGFEWRVAKPPVGWDARFQQLVEYRKESGNCNVPQAYPGLGRWVMKQRTEYTALMKGKKSQLSGERIKNLEAIGFSWRAPGYRKKEEKESDEPDFLTDEL